MKNKVVYRHRRLDNNTVFYIGIGSIKRSKCKTHRSKWWKRVALKYGYKIEVLTDFLTWEDCCEIEMLLIAEYGRLDKKTGCLVNMTDGGEGCIGRKMSEANKKKLSIANKGNKRMLGSKRSEETKLRMSQSALGIKPNSLAKERMAAAKRGKKISDKHRQKIINSNLGNQYMLGKKHTIDSKYKMSTVVLLNPLTGIFYTISEAAEMLNMNYGTLTKQTKGELPNKTPLIRI